MMAEFRQGRRSAGRTLPLCAILPLAAPAAASAQSVTVTPLLDTRARYESFEQDGLPRDAEALTVRVRPGIVVGRGGLAALVEAEATVGLVRRFNDGFNGLTMRPLIPDADNIEINRAQLSYRTTAGTLTVGRQLLEVADQRFIGSASFRQNQQTFDAARAQWTLAKGLTADIGYAWSVRTTAGRKGRGARPRAIAGDNAFALLGYATPIGTLTGYTYLIDQDQAAVQGYRLDNRNYGVRLAGSRPLPADLRLSYTASYAWQRDHHRNPNRYDAHYYTGEATLARRVVAGTIGYEVLGADDGRPFTSFQTPDDSAFRFQGWAGRFITTPPDGVRDLYATVGSTWKRKGAVNAIGGQVTAHRFQSDRLVRHYGDELDLLATVRIERVTLAARYAGYRADRFATDVRRFWLSTEWSL